MYLAIDPGNDTGFALFRSVDDLVFCGVGEVRNRKGLEDVKTVIVEEPQVYIARKMKGNPNDLIKLAVDVGRKLQHFEDRGARTCTVKPGDWKGQVPKDIHHARVWGELSESAKMIVQSCGRGVPASIRHNMMDAVALGRWAFTFRRWA